MTSNEITLGVHVRQSIAWNKLHTALLDPEATGLNSVKSIQDWIQNERDKIEKWIQKQERNIA